MPEHKTVEYIRLPVDARRVFEAAARNSVPAINLGFDMILHGLQRMATQALETKDPVFLTELHYMGVITLKPEQLELAETDLKARGKYS